jgi:hypothetical protein
MRITHEGADPTKLKIIFTGMKLPNGVLIEIEYNEATKEVFSRVVQDIPQQELGEHC